MVKLYPQWIGNGSRKMNPFVSSEALPVLSGSLQVLACLLVSGQIGEPATGNATSQKLEKRANSMDLHKNHISTK